MNKPPASTLILAWYRVPELWLILILLGATVIGSFALLATAIQTPDTHVAVPNDVPRSSRIPPAEPAATPVKSTSGDDGNTP
ncbi:hypothetical protein [Dokdonella sp.]|uniref:hypothetical protein n=1 Tax=Dokdonella sp. TaxID=2291710 RepID=UPI003C580CF6